jgi:hypothetical protein
VDPDGPPTFIPSNANTLNVRCNYIFGFLDQTINKDFQISSDGYFMCFIRRSCRYPSLYAIERYSNWWIINWKVFGRKRWWSNWGTLLTFPWRDWESLLKKSVSVVYIPSKSRTEDLWNVSLVLRLHQPTLWQIFCSMYFHYYKLPH